MVYRIKSKLISLSTVLIKKTEKAAAFFCILMKIGVLLHWNLQSLYYTHTTFPKRSLSIKTFFQIQLA